MDLSSSYLKTTRANEHLDVLRKELGTFYDSKPCKFQEKVDVKNQTYNIRIVVEAPPDRLSVIAGDVFGCLRACLDHLVWSLVTLNTASYAEYTRFPIMEKVNAASLQGQIRGSGPS